MRKLLPLFALLACAACLHGAEPLETPIMPSSELRRGMEGYGLSTFAPGPPQKFAFKVLSVVQGWWPKGEIILIEMTGPVVDQARIISGMSGSPVYIEDDGVDKLIGAVAYGWNFPKTGLAGVQPIEQMLKVAKIGRAERARSAAGAKAARRRTLHRRHEELAGLLAAPRITAEQTAGFDAKLLRMMTPALRIAPALGKPPEGVAQFLPRDGGGMRPLPLPVSIGGHPVNLVAALHAGRLPVMGAAAPAPRRVPGEPLGPGSPINVVYVAGDIDIAASGTVTWTRGDELLAFGHPDEQLGASNYPLAQGHVDAIVASVASSFRLASTGKIVGRLVQDRDSGIWGRVDKPAPMFPLQVRVGGASPDVYNYEVAAWWPSAGWWTFVASALSAMRLQGLGHPAMITAESTISIKGRKAPLKLRNTYFTHGLYFPLYDLLESPLSALTANAFEEVEIDGVTVDIAIDRDVEFAVVEAVVPRRTEVAPGEELILRVSLRRYHGERQMRGKLVTRDVVLKIPADVRPGTQVKIAACSADVSRQLDYSLDPGFYDPKDLDALVEALGRMEPNRNLVLRADFTRTGLRYDGAAMPALPPSTMGVLLAGRSATEKRPLIADRKTAQATPWVLQGSAATSVRIKRGGTASDE
jgi:hypothetical protein